MRKPRINKILGLFNEIFIISAVFFIPIIFSPPFFLTANTFELNKIILFKILTLLTLLSVLLRVVIFRRERRRLLRQISAYRWYLFIPAIYLLIILAASIFSIDQEKSFFGLYDRQQGLISSLYYFLFFVLILLSVDSGKKFNRIIIAIITSSAIVSVYGLAQRLGYDFMRWSESIDITGRITSTFGQPNYLGSYLLIVIPITAYYAIKGKNLLIKFLFSCILLLQFINFVYIYSISSWLSLLAGLFLAGVLYIIFKKGQLSSIFKRIRHKKPFLLVVLLFVAVFGAAAYGLNNSNYLKTKIDSLFSLEGSAGARILLWQASIDAIAKRPFLGYGPETQGDVLVKYYTRDWGVYNYVNDRPNRAHNIILDTLLTSGIIGLASFVALIYFFYKLLFLSIKRHNNSTYPYFIFLSLTGYLASLQLNFSFIATDIYFWILLALTFYFYIHGAESELNLPTGIEKEKKYNKPGELFIKLILLLIIIYPTGYAISRQVKHFISDYYYFWLKIADKEGDYFAVMQYYDDIEELLGIRAKYLKQAAMPISNYLLRITDPRFRRPGEERLVKVLKTIRSDSYSNKILKAKIFSGLTTKNDKLYYREAIQEYSEVINMSPEMPNNYMELARFYTTRGEYDKALLNYETAMEKLPKLNDPRLNYLKIDKIKRELHYGLTGIGDVYFLKKEFIKAVEYYLLAEGYYKKDTNIYRKLISGYYMQGNFEKAVYYGEIAYDMEKNNYIWPLILGQLYYERNNYEKALFYTEQAGYLDPNNSKIKDLYNNIINEINKAQE